MNECDRPTCFHNQLKKILKKFPNSEKSISGHLDSLKNDPTGNVIPGFSPYVVKKTRLALVEYRISKRAGLRVVYFVREEKDEIMMISIYHKGAYKKESDIMTMLKENLKSIVSP